MKDPSLIGEICAFSSVAATTTSLFSSASISSAPSIVGSSSSAIAADSSSSFKKPLQHLNIETQFLLAPNSTHVSSSDSFLTQTRKNDASIDLIFTVENNAESPSSTAKLEWKPTFNPFLFGSFESVNPLEEEKVSLALLSGEASSCLSSNLSRISAGRGRVASARVNDVVGSLHLHRREEVISKMLSLACGDFSSFSLGGSLHGFVYRTGKAMYGRCGAFHHTREMFDVWCHRGIQELVSSNSTVSGYMCASDANSAPMLFDKMTRCISPSISLVKILHVCASVGASLLGKHGYDFANYALGTLGGDPLDTTGIIELGGASTQFPFLYSSAFEYSHPYLATMHKLFRSTLKTKTASSLVYAVVSKSFQENLI
ncbi:Pentatricopeptide repeat-containing protein At5g16860 family [Sesbania bispinosa]|nr:Pentatricopeptide repeat-containing protein At5g16860 family [Sesbania bispinosa]